MANLPLAFAELLAGGIMLTAGITGNTLGNVVKGDLTAGLTAAPLTGASTTSAAGASTGRSSSTARLNGTVSDASYGRLIGSGGVTPTSFAKALLQAIGAPLTNANISSIVDWEAQEGGNWENTAQYNPLNTTQAEPGYSETGTQGDIGSYTSWAQGLDATVQTLEGSDYTDIVSALKSGSGLIGEQLKGLYIWSGGGYSTVSP